MEGAEGAGDGSTVGGWVKVGCQVKVGVREGDSVIGGVGLADGLSVERKVGNMVGFTVGLAVGRSEGAILGQTEGLAVGFPDGFFVLQYVGVDVGWIVGARVGTFGQRKLHTLSLHIANGLQQSASLVQPYPDIVGTQFIPMAGL